MTLHVTVYNAQFVVKTCKVVGQGFRFLPQGLCFSELLCCLMNQKNKNQFVLFLLNAT